MGGETSESEKGLPFTEEQLAAFNRAADEHFAFVAQVMENDPSALLSGTAEFFLDEDESSLI